MKRNMYLSLSAACLLAALLLSLAWARQQGQDLASRIGPKVLRFHVLAESNSKKDQEMKLQVRDLLLRSIYDAIGGDASLEETKEYIRNHGKELERQAENYMRSKGYPFPAHIQLTHSYFPTKAYGDVVFPNGYYDAAQVTIGSGKGHNWWCVLYPPLCFVDSAYALVPGPSKEKLEEAIGEQDFKALLRKEPFLPGNKLPKTGAGHKKVHIRLKILDLLGWD